MSMMGELKFFLGLQIRQQRNDIFISQEKYLKDVLRKFGMQDCKGVKIPMPTNGHLCTDENGIDFDHKVYRSMIGSLLHLCASRPDIMLSVCMCARFQAAPKESHHLAVKRILRYLAHPNTRIMVVGGLVRHMPTNGLSWWGRVEHCRCLETE